MTSFERVKKALEVMPGVTLGPSKFGAALEKPLAAFVRDREFAHFHGRSAIDIRLTRLGIKRMRDVLREIPTRLDWVEIQLGSRADMEHVVALLKTAREVNAFR